MPATAYGQADAHQDDEDVGSTHLALVESVQVQEGTAGEGLRPVILTSELMGVKVRD
jgi:hypothetical protein